MTKEELVKKIMAECEADGEPVTLEEAEEMADMEIKAKDVKRYEHAEEPQQKKERKPRKADEEKRGLVLLIADTLRNLDLISDLEIVGAETEVAFSVGENEYSVKLIRHRPRK